MTNINDDYNKISKNVKRKMTKSEIILIYEMMIYDSENLIAELIKQNAEPGENVWSEDSPLHFILTHSKKTL